jgi:hypothetical protein
MEPLIHQMTYSELEDIIFEVTGDRIKVDQTFKLSFESFGERGILVFEQLMQKKLGLDGLEKIKR